jgi:adenosine 3'-phospho 5'-phosphosulfate transporter B2
MATENLELGVDSFGQVEDKSGTWCGVMLLLLFLFFDSFTSQWQSRMFSKHEYVFLSTLAWSPDLVLHFLLTREEGFRWPSFLTIFT